MAKQKQKELSINTKIIISLSVICSIMTIFSIGLIVGLEGWQMHQDCEVLHIHNCYACLMDNKSYSILNDACESPYFKEYLTNNCYDVEKYCLE